MVKWGETTAQTNTGGDIKRLQWGKIPKDGSVDLRFIGDLLPHYLYWVDTPNGRRTRACCHFNRATEEFDMTMDDPIGRLLGPREPDLKPQFSYATKAIDRADGSIVIVELKPTIYNLIRDLAKNGEYGDPADPKEGYDIKIEKKSTGPLKQNVKYTILPGRNNSPLTADELELIEKDKMDLNKLYKQETPDEQLAWMKENGLLQVEAEGDHPDPTTNDPEFDPNDDVPF